jgi:hypothetical protein
MRHRLVRPAGRSVRFGTRVAPRPTLGPRQQVRQHRLCSELVGGARPTHITRSQRPVEADQPGDTVAAEVARPEVTAVTGLPVVTWTGVLAAARQIRRAPRFFDPPRFPRAIRFPRALRWSRAIRFPGPLSWFRPLRFAGARMVLTGWRPRMGLT